MCEDQDDDQYREQGTSLFPDGVILFVVMDEGLSYKVVGSIVHILGAKRHVIDQDETWIVLSKTMLLNYLLVSSSLR